MLQSKERVMTHESFESILVVFQNPVTGRREPYVTHWYTNIHIRDAMRLEGAIATQRFVVADDQPVLGGERVVPGYWAHTVYEWESAAKSVQGHAARAGTPLMEITRATVILRPAGLLLSAGVALARLDARKGVSARPRHPHGNDRAAGRTRD